MPDPIRLSLPRIAFDEFESIARLNGRMEEVVALLDQLTPLACPKEVGEYLSSKLEIPQGAAQTLVSALMSVSAISRVMGLAPPEGVASLSRLIEEQASTDWKAHNSEGWREAAKTLPTLIAPNSPFSVMEKASRLGVQRESLLERSSILTDIRPVFSEDASSILRAVITNTLFLEMYDGSTRRQTAIALDRRDLKALKDQCERALVKVDTIARAVSPLGWTIAAEDTSND